MEPISNKELKTLDGFKKKVEEEINLQLLNWTDVKIKEEVEKKIQNVIAKLNLEDHVLSIIGASKTWAGIYDLSRSNLPIIKELKEKIEEQLEKQIKQLDYKAQIKEEDVKSYYQTYYNNLTRGLKDAARRQAEKKIAEYINNIERMEGKK